MQNAAAYRPNDDLDDLLALSADVMSSAPATTKPVMTAREAARAIVGITGWVSRRSGQNAMQKAMADIARHVDAWRPASPFHSLPTRYDGRVDENVVLISCVISSLVPLFGLGPLRAAVAFWATENDPAIWQSIAEA